MDRKGILLSTWSTDASINSVAVSPDGTLVVSGSRDNTLRFWDVRSGTDIDGPLEGHSGSIRSVGFSFDGSRVASGSDDCTIRVWGVKSNTATPGLLEGHTRSVLSVAFSPDGAWIASGSSDHTIRIWDTKSGGTKIQPLKGHKGPVRSVVYSSNSTHIVSGSDDKTIRIWDTNDGSMVVRPLEGHTRGVDAVALSSDSTRIASGSRDFTVRVWDAESGAMFIGPLRGHTDWVRSVDFSPDGTQIVSGSYDRTIRVWDAKSGSPVESLQGHISWVYSLVYSSDSTRIISGSRDCTVRIWDARLAVQEAQSATSTSPIKSSDDGTNAPDEPSISNECCSLRSESQRSVESLDPMEQSSGAVVEITPGEMSVSEIFDCLLEHGCIDISPNIDPTGFSSIATAGGNFGDVWQGKLLNGDKVAVKCLRFTAIVEDRPKGLKRLMRETYMWSKAKHDNIQQLMGITMFQGRLGMISLWREHGNMRDYIRRNPGIDRLQLCVQVALGVSYLHSIDMIHGDIKALNVLVSADGFAKLSDFDHSILSNCTLAFSATSNVGGGTLRWMAPELLLMTDDESNTGVLRTTQTDIYALGMTMLEIFTGKVPYAEYGSDATIYGALFNKRPPARPKGLTSPAPHADEIWSVLRRCWNHAPSARPDALSVLVSLQCLDIEHIVEHQ